MGIRLGASQDKGHMGRTGKGAPPTKRRDALITAGGGGAAGELGEGEGEIRGAWGAWSLGGMRALWGRGKERNARSRIGRVRATDESTRAARGWEN